MTNAKVWALDRRVFQQVMKKTGLQRIDDNLKFLRSVPLFERLTTDHMSKIADVLEVVSVSILIAFIIIIRIVLSVKLRCVGYIEAEEVGAPSIDPTTVL